ncbi:replicative helicase loader/inhibitor [Cytobacillus massiliigabonensis]|uniref:replicative helicase loader/inhibitor n=1 Tax=Cytobacillus massiliigabonensis TaxID=1871011 RepID=UPI000C83A12C|nr:replicative helicase loader/inhibitor [Cytobacillus massiliigabonensis]
MNKKEVIQVLATIESVYPQFKISDEMVLMWLSVSKRMDFKLVMQKLAAYIAKHPFPPVLAEIAVFQEKENHFLQQTKQWEQEGRERIERDQLFARRKPTPDWLSTSSRK